MPEARSCSDPIEGAFDLRLLGGFDLSRGGIALELPSRKARALLAYLAAQRGHPVARDALTSLLWPDSPPAAARHSLRQTLTHLRHALGPNAIESHPGGDVRLPAASDLVADIELFEDAARRAASSHRHEAETCAATAMRLYRGDLLSGIELSGAEPYEVWLATERARLRDLAQATLERLERLCERRGEPRAAAQYAERRLRMDDLSETIARRLATLLAASGLRARALAELERLRERLARELDALPEPATTRLVERLRSGGLPTVPDETPPAIVPRHVPVLPLLEREEALERLAGDWAEVRRGRSRVSLLLGEGGSGKTRLARTAIDDLATGEEVTVVATCGCAATLEFPGALLARLLDAQDLESLLAELKGPFSLPPRTDRSTETARPARARVLLLDDLDVLDPRREEALVNLAQRLAAGAPVWWLATSLSSERGRTANLTRRIGTALDAPVCTQELGPLSPASLRQVALTILDADEARELVRLLERAETALPLEIAELLTLLADLDVLTVGSDGAWRLAARIATLDVPRGLSLLLDRRVGSLPPTARRLLALAAAAGPCFDVRSLALAEGEDEAIVARAVETLVERWFVRPLPSCWRATSDDPPVATAVLDSSARAFEFSQRTTRRLLLDSIDPARLRALEHRLALARSA